MHRADTNAVDQMNGEGVMMHVLIKFIKYNDICLVANEKLGSEQMLIRNDLPVYV